MSSTMQARESIRQSYRRQETDCVEALLAEVALTPDQRRRIEADAVRLVQGVRATRLRFGSIDSFLNEYGLSTNEGVALMCLAEALLRIPDTATADALIRDKLGSADWDSHLGTGDSVLMNASTWALMFSGKIMNLGDGSGWRPSNFLAQVTNKLGSTVIRQAMYTAMKVLGRQFVMGRTITEALDRAKDDEKHGYRHSFDMLGEGARTDADAERYFATYYDAIDSIGKSSNGRGPVAGPGISVKLSALHPRYSFANADACVPVLVDRLTQLAARCHHFDIALCVDAEEADRLEPSLDILAAVAAKPSLRGWDGFGLAVQAYQKRAPALVSWLSELAHETNRRLMVRLVKGAYWDSEIKRGQERGLDSYPVYTRKITTDTAYLTCAKRLFAAGPARIFPAFATHNAHTVAAIREFAAGSRDFEFQRLHGMGEPLYHQVVQGNSGPIPCRVYAPVGSHEDLLPYLVRRLLENGANSSFIHRLRDDAAPVAEIVSDPVAALARMEHKPHSRIPLPAGLYGAERVNSAGLDLSDPLVVAPLTTKMRDFAAQGSWTGGPIVCGEQPTGRAQTPLFSPHDRAVRVGSAADATLDDVERALSAANRAFDGWDRRPVDERAAPLRRFAELLEANTPELMALLAREAGKTWGDALAEIREAVDFCRYYAAQAIGHFSGGLALPGVTGESNNLYLRGRGVFLCISPWNFPLAIFTGQIAAALAAGNCVIAKPAEQTPLIAARAVALALEAGIPADVLHLLPGPGETVGAALVKDLRIAGVAFTGSTETARIIARTLLDRGGPLVPLIAETGGQNAMIVDNSALAEQVTDDVIGSAFLSAGQRCSALRVLYVQDGIANRVIDMLRGAVATLRIGDPLDLATDIGPVIDRQQQAILQAHAQNLTAGGKQLFAGHIPDAVSRGSYFAPHAFEIDSIAALEREVFGPVLHVVRWRGDRLDAVIDAINGTGYGLTAGIHSRIEGTVRHVLGRLRVGNAYVNRNMVGAVVGTQPFGGEGLSGTGPKAGGPHYLLRFAAERCQTVNIAAAGGNIQLVSLMD
jgi:RHH-type transcriptional regulator, proline utilization regulon repressor / proline dehydrogenase / delta 1-pyrroline-5-carboxylate dehydrogenase